MFSRACVHGNTSGSRDLGTVHVATRIGKNGCEDSSYTRKFLHRVQGESKSERREEEIATMLVCVPACVLMHGTFSTAS